MLGARLSVWICLVAATQAFLTPSLPSSISYSRSVRGCTATRIRCEIKSDLATASMDRRDVLAGAILAGSLSIVPDRAVLADPVPVKAPPGALRTVVITGSNSGIGRDAAAKLAAGGYNVILACRTKQKAIETQEAIKKEIAASAGAISKPELIPMECDLSSFQSIRSFAASLKALALPIDVLVCNAGLSLSTDAKPPPPRTKDGFELTVGTNHLGHFLLCNLLLKDLLANPRGARIVVTASQVHDPSSPGGNVGSKATLGDLQGLMKGTDWDMVDGGSFDGDKAYKDSKLCNVLFTRELSARLAKLPSSKKVTVNCFSPGLITRTGLFRNQGSIFVPIFDFAVNNVFRVGETVDFGGDCLIKMAVGEELNSKSGVFYANNPGKHTFQQTEVSVEARDAAKAKKLWDLSVKATRLGRDESPLLL